MSIKSNPNRVIRFKIITFIEKLIWINLVFSLNFFNFGFVRCVVCPPRDLIRPCQCINYFNLIECTNITSNGNLKQIFVNLKHELDKQRARPVYDEFKLVQTQLKQFGSFDDIFSGVSFRRISFSRNNRLKRIDPKAFVSSYNITTEFMIEDSELLGSEHEDNIALFEAINRFVGLNTLHLTDNGVRFIPREAFNKSQPALRELFLTDNQIERIEDYAFTKLNSLQLINLDGNRISQLSLRSLELNNSTQNLLRIFMRSNKLQTKTFPPGIFSLLRRRVYLNLNLNNMTKIPQNVFQSFFKRGSILSVSKNPLKCDCDFKWLLDQGILYNSSHPEDKYLLRDYQCISSKNEEQLIDEVNHSDFEHCPPSSINDSLQQCLDQAVDQEQENICLNHNSTHRLNFILTISLMIIEIFISF